MLSFQLGLRIQMITVTIMIPQYYTQESQELNAHLIQFCYGSISYSIEWTQSKLLFSINQYYNILNQWSV